MARVGKIRNTSTPTEANIVFLLSPLLHLYDLDNSFIPKVSKKEGIIPFATSILLAHQARRKSRTHHDHPP